MAAKAKRKPKVLIVEDDKMLLRMYTIKFEKDGFEVITAIDGAQAIAEAMKSKPDAILLDIIMPKLDGFAVLKQLKAEGQTKSIPVLLLTNLGQQEDVKKGRAFGAEDYLIKASYTPANIVTKVKLTIEGRKKK